MCVDIQGLVNQVKPVLLAVVAENVLLLATIAQFEHAASDQVVDTAPVVDENKTIVRHPVTRNGHFLVLVHESECFLKAVFLITFCSGRDHLFHHTGVELQQVKGVFQR